MSVTVSIPAIALKREDAAEAIGMSLDSFERYVQPELRLIRRGRLVLVGVGELERWCEENAAPTIGVWSAPTGRDGGAAL